MEPYLYSIIQKKDLQEILTAFHTCVGLTIQVLADTGKVLLSCGEEYSFCKCFQKHIHQPELCPEFHKKAAQHSMLLGETYTFCCHANVNHIVFPLVSRETLFGSILVGPFLLTEPDTIMMEDLVRRYSFSTSQILELYEESSSIPMISPAKANQISRLLFYLFSNAIADSRQQLIMNQEKLHQQSRINESIQRYKSIQELNTLCYPIEKERLLLQKVRTGSVAEAKGILNDLLGYVLFSEGNSLEHIKTRAMELCSLLSRTAIEGGAVTDSIFKINNAFLAGMNSIQTFEDLCYHLQEIVEVFTESMFPNTPAAGNETIQKAISYINAHFTEKLLLEDVAEYVYLNPTYFSTLFKQATGSSFREYLNMVRIEEAKRLLENSSYSVMDIAIASGFEDQSYFSKVFKKFTGLSPRQYR